MSQPNKYIYTPEFIFSFKAINNKRMPELEEFLSIYHGVEEQDKIKPIFSQTTKYKSFPLNFIPKKFSKKMGNGKRKLLVRGGEGTWRPYTPLTSVEKMKQIIVSTLNKLTNKNFSEMSGELLKSLYSINCTDALHLLATEILKKAYYDSDYIHLYVTLASRIWSNREWHRTLITIISNSETEFYWCENKLEVQDSISFNGPFTTDKEAISDAMNTINFKKNLLAICQNEFVNRMKQIKESRNEELDEEEQYKLRRRVFSTLEFIELMYNSKHLAERVMHTIIIDLLHLEQYDTDTETYTKRPPEEDIEGFVIVWKILYNSKRKPFSQKYIDQYMNCVEEWLLPLKWSKRIEYMLIDVLEMVNGKKKELVKVDDDTLIEKLNTIMINYLKDDDVTDCIKNAQKYDVDSKKLQQYIIETILSFATDHEKKHDALVRLTKELYKLDLFINALNSVYEMLSDIALDVPEAAKNLGEFVALINEKIDHKLLKQVGYGVKGIGSEKLCDDFVTAMFRKVWMCTRIVNKKVLQLPQLLKEYKPYMTEDTYTKMHHSLSAE